MVLKGTKILPFSKLLVLKGAILLPFCQRNSAKRNESAALCCCLAGTTAEQQNLWRQSLVEPPHQTLESHIGGTEKWGGEPYQGQCGEKYTLAPIWDATAA